MPNSNSNVASIRRVLASATLDPPEKIALPLPVAANENQVQLAATPYVRRDPRSIPPRPWIYGRQCARGLLSLVVSPGATGKTALLVGTALAMATGRNLLGKEVRDGPKRVWLWNLEDSGEELARLIEAGCIHWRIAPEDMADRLFVDSGLDGAELKIAVEDRDGCRILKPVIDALVAELRAKEIDVLIVDPFVSSHAVNENNNGAIDAVAKQWAKVAVEAGCSIMLAHHTRKIGGAEANAESARGAVALIAAARSVMVLSKMTKDEANVLGIEGENRRRHFRAYDDKNNRAPPASESDWYQLVGVDLDNGGDGPGDNMQVVVPWTPPDAFDGVTIEHLDRLQLAMGETAYPHNPQSDDWIGEKLADILGWDIANQKATQRRRLQAIIDTYVANGALQKVDRKCPKSSKVRPFVIVGERVEPESLRAFRHGGTV